MKSISDAHKLSSSTIPILVGGKKHASIDISCCGIDILPPMYPAECIATHCRSLFIKCHGVEGMLYRVGEHLLVGDSHTTTTDTNVIQVTEFFGVSISSQWHTFVRGNVLQHQDDEADHDYSGSPYVKPTSTVKVFSSAKILCKVMLFPDPNCLDSPTSFVVIDFMRPNPPLMLDDILIPAFPERGDMVKC